MHLVYTAQVIFKEMNIQVVSVGQRCKLCTEKLRVETIETMVPRTPFQGYWNRSWRETKVQQW